MRCGEGTTFYASSANGRNPMKRVCNGCAATDRAVSRNAKRDPSVRKALAGKSPADLQSWYKAQKRDRLAAESRARRQFADLRAELTDVATTGEEWRESDDYEVFEDYAARQILLGKAEDLKGAEELWQKELADETRAKIFVRGVWCFARFRGLKNERVDGNFCESRLVQSKAVSQVDGLEDLAQRQQEALQKRRKLCLSLKPVTPCVSPKIPLDEIEGALELPAVSLNAMFRRVVERELGRRAEEERNEDERLVADLAVREAEQQRAKREKTESREFSVEKVALEALLGAQKQKIDGAGCRAKQQAAAEVGEVRKVLEGLEDEGVQEAGAKHIEKLNTSVEAYFKGVATLRDEMSEQVGACTSLADLDRVSAWLKGATVELAVEKLKTFRNEVSAIREWRVQLQKTARKMLASAAQASASKRRLSEGGEASEVAVVDALLRAHREGETGLPAGTHFGDDFVAAGRTVITPPERGQAFIASITSCSYYASQKSWVHQHMLKNGLTFSAAEIMRQKVKDEMRKNAREALDAAVYDRMPIAGDDEAWLAAVYDSQFWLMSPQHAGLAPTPFCLNEVRAVAEGSMLLAGLPLASIAGESYAEKVGRVAGMTRKAFLDSARQAGFVAIVAAGQFAVIPGGFLVLEAGLGKAGEAALEQHVSGLRWSFAHPVDAKREVSLEAHLTAMLAAWPALRSTEYGLLLRKVAAA